MTVAQWKNVYDQYQKGEFYMLVQSDAIIVVDPPEEGAKEAVLRLFLTTGEAERYRDAANIHDARILKTTLVGLWNLIPRIDALTMKKFKLPVRIEVSTWGIHNDLRTVEPLHSNYELLS